MDENWDKIFEMYVHKIHSPDGRDTFESTTKLVRRIIDFSAITSSDTVIDMGSGWGNLTIKLSEKAKRVIGIEPNRKNIDTAKRRIEEKGINNVEFIKGTFENPKCNKKVDLIFSSLVFHQVKYRNKKKALKNVNKMLNVGGKLILCGYINAI